MKIIKTYALSEKTLSNDIDKFIRDAKKGAYQYDYKYNQEGLKILKAYFRMIEQEVKKANYSEAIDTYEKLFGFLFQRDYDYFNYEDIIGKFTMEKYVGNYFYALIQNKEDVFKKYIEYLKLTDEYYFESAFQTINVNLSEQELREFIEEVGERLKTVQTEEYCYYELADILVNYYKHKDQTKYIELKEKYKDLVEEEDAKKS